jgi:hypothetical protein
VDGGLSDRLPFARQGRRTFAHLIARTRLLDTVEGRV